MNLFQCPSDVDQEPNFTHGHVEGGEFDPCDTTAESYVFIGWALDQTTLLTDPTIDPNREDAINFVDVALMNELIAAITANGAGDPTGMLGDLSTADKAAYRLREGIERFFVTDINNPASSTVAQSELPVMWDQVSANPDQGGFNHIPGGSNVLYMDGHVEFQRWPGEHPITRAWQQAYDLADTMI